METIIDTNSVSNDFKVYASKFWLIIHFGSSIFAFCIGYGVYSESKNKLSFFLPIVFFLIMLWRFKLLMDANNPKIEINKQYIKIDKKNKLYQWENIENEHVSKGDVENLSYLKFDYLSPSKNEKVEISIEYLNISNCEFQKALENFRFSFENEISKKHKI